MTHVLIVGMTESGKTTLAKELCHRHQKHGTQTVVLDPLGDPGWNADFQTRDPVEFLETCKRSVSCAIFLDESAQTVGRYNDEMFWLATSARHLGHKSHFITQRAAQLSPTVRGQCRHLFCFNVSKDDCKALAADFNNDQLLLANVLKQFECIYTSRFGSTVKITVVPHFRK